MPFVLRPGVSVGRRPETGAIYSLEHLEQPYLADTSTDNPKILSSKYLHDVADIYRIPESMLRNLNDLIGSEPTNEPTSLRFRDERTRAITTVVSYVQTISGLPIWEAAFSVTMLPNPLRVVSSTSSVRVDIEIENPSKKAAYYGPIEPPVLGRLLGLEGRSPTIGDSRLLVYHYRPDRRIDIEEGEVHLPLPDVPADAVTAKKYYVVREVFFSLGVEEYGGDMYWRTFIEVNTGAVLFLRAGCASTSVTGYVFIQDPKTQDTDGPDATATSDKLNKYRQTVTFEVDDLNPQKLKGTFIKSKSANATAPTSTSDTFEYDVRTDNFSAVSAYFQLDKLYRMITSLGYDVTKIFSGTYNKPGFPIPADFRGFDDKKNAKCYGNKDHTGAGGYKFGLITNSTENGPVGMADAPRISAHEFCHALLWDAVHSPNFGFAHSAGDSIASILNDPGSQAADRFTTYPWAENKRRHDRKVKDGWGWGGFMDDDTEPYDQEQILSTTLFRIYQALGGDGTENDQNTPTWASTYVVYLIVGGIASLTPETDTSNASVFATAMMNADSGSIGFDSEPGGAARKVIRWGFEKQDLYGGKPPTVDVYIDDGRQGEYQYRDVYWDTTDIWNRRSADGGTDHQNPKFGVDNFAYVRIKNRGTEAATGVTVSGFQCSKFDAGMTWPDSWEAMKTSEITLDDDLASNGVQIVGPFTWSPVHAGHECLLMSVSASDDLSNIDQSSMLPCATGPISVCRLVPFDNNIAQRNVEVIPADIPYFRDSMHGRKIWVANPYNRNVQMTVRAELPPFLRKRNWVLSFSGLPDNNTFSLGPRANREIVIELPGGDDFGVRDVGMDPMIRVIMVIDGKVVGGMSYLINV